MATDINLTNLKFYRTNPTILARIHTTIHNYSLGIDDIVVTKLKFKLNGISMKIEDLAKSFRNKVKQAITETVESGITENMEGAELTAGMLMTTLLVEASALIAACTNVPHEFEGNLKLSHQCLDHHCRLFFKQNLSENSIKFQYD